MTETIDAPPARVTARARKRRPDSRYEALAKPLLARLAAGVSVQAACRDPDMPHWSSMDRWLRTEPGRPGAAAGRQPALAGGQAGAGRLRAFAPAGAGR